MIARFRYENKEGIGKWTENKWRNCKVCREQLRQLYHYED